ncbi:MAG: DHH family phosphoesterase [Candidatus Pacearchaeota archaeon]
MLKEVENFVKIFLEKTKDKKIHLVSHFDTDGITSAAIFSRTLERLNKEFTIKIVKQLDEQEIKSFPEERIIVLIDLGSNSLKYLSQIKNQIFIIDHHEIIKKDIPENIGIINPHLLKNYEELCSAELTYIISRRISQENRNLSHLAILGMIGDTMERNINKLRNEIINDANVTIKRGLLIYPSTRPIDRALEFSSRPFIPGVTGNSQGTYELLKEAGIERQEKSYPSLIDLNEDEMKRLVTAVLLRVSSKESKDYIGNLYLVKLFNKIEDAREISAIINACSRMGNPHIALMLCMGNSDAKRKAERIYVKYRQHLISALKYIDQNNKIIGKEYVIINARDNVKDTIIGTLASILSFSQVYREGTIIVAMAYNEDKIKVSTRISGRNPINTRNLKELMESVADLLGGEAGGHKNAAGCTICKEHENKFIELLKQKLDFELIKV